MHNTSQSAQAKFEKDSIDLVLCPPATDRRSAPRVELLIRAAKLIADGTEFICITRDASPAGIKVRVFHPIPNYNELFFETSAGNRYPVDLIWCNQDYAGLQFKEDVDLGGLIDDRNGAFSKRPLRVHVSLNITILSGGSSYNAILRDISQHGACIECPDYLMINERVELDFGTITSCHAKVRWRRESLYGLSFEHILDFDQLARLLAEQSAA